MLRRRRLAWLEQHRQQQQPKQLRQQQRQRVLPKNSNSTVFVFRGRTAGEEEPGKKQEKLIELKWE